MKVSSVGIIGGGTMGSGIAESAVVHGLPVILVDLDGSAAARAKDAIADRLRRAAQKGRMTEADADTAIALLSPADDPLAVATCDLVIEAVFEDLDVKKNLFAKLDDIVGPATLVASNTSSYRVDDLADSISHPERFLGMHYFVPAGTNRLVEIVEGAKTSEDTLESATAFARATGKEPLPCKDSNGFVVNRFFIPFFNEAIRIHEDGIETGQVDEVARDVLAAAVGPFFVLNLSKVRIGLHSCQTLVTFGKFYEPAALLRQVGEADGAFEIHEGPALEPTRRQEVADRLRAAIFQPVLELLDEGITDAAGVDLGARLALRWDNPPCRMMDELGRDEVARMLENLSKRFGTRIPASLDRVGTLVS